MEAGQQVQIPSFFMTMNCQVGILRNSLPVTLKPSNNSKAINISLRQPRWIVVHCLSTNEMFYEFDVKHVKGMHTSFMQEGKLTVVLEDCKTRVVPKTLNESMGGVPFVEIQKKVFVKGATPCSLQLLVKTVSEWQTRLKLSIQKGVKERSDKANRAQDAGQPAPSRAKQHRQQLRESKPHQTQEVFSRKRLMKLATQDKAVDRQRIKKSSLAKPTIPKPRPNFFNQLAMDTFMTVLSYSGVSLQYRLLSKECSETILRFVPKLTLHDDIPEPTFHKLTKFCLHVTCRMRNVKHINQFVNNTIDGPLVPINSKWLRFTKWKEIKSKNIDQLLGVRIYCLELPYKAAISSESLVGMNLAWLVLRGTGEIRNTGINDDHIVSMVNRLTCLTRLEIARFDGEKLQAIDDKNKLKLLRISTMQVGSKFSWETLNKFQSLGTLEIANLVSKSTNRLLLQPTQTIRLPLSIHILKLGPYFDTSRLELLPATLQNLTIESPSITNNHMYQLHLPSLKSLRVDQCPLLTPQAFENIVNVQLTVRWADYILQNVQKEFKSRNVTITNVTN